MRYDSMACGASQLTIGVSISKVVELVTERHLPRRCTSAAAFHSWRCILPTPFYRCSNCCQHSRARFTVVQGLPAASASLLCRTGVCPQGQPRCPLSHPSEYVTPCGAFVASGRCGNPACTLQHRVVADLMPLCIFHFQVHPDLQHVLPLRSIHC
jgi:hypothetical protein